MSELTQEGRKALVTVAEWLEDGAPHKKLGGGLQLDAFDMETVVQVDPTCGTSCCIAGAVCQFERLGMNARDKLGGLEWMGDNGAFDMARDFIGMSDCSARSMFMPWVSFDGQDDSFNSAARGAAVIRHFLATGEVDWDRFDDSGKVVVEVCEE